MSSFTVAGWNRSGTALVARSASRMRVSGGKTYGSMQERMCAANPFRNIFRHRTGSRTRPATQRKGITQSPMRFSPTNSPRCSSRHCRRIPSRQGHAKAATVFKRKALQSVRSVSGGCPKA